MIAIQNLDFRYEGGEFRLQVPRLDIADGARTAVIGPSGSGKTTFLNLVCGILVPRQGSVTVDGCELPSLSDSQRRNFRVAHVGFVFQDFELLEYLNVLDNILYPFRINGYLVYSRDVRDRARQLAQETGLADKLGRLPDQLSQGEKQRAAICRALLLRPKLLLADEPTGNLDPASKDRVLGLLLQYVQSEGATLVTVTHDHSLLKHFDQVIDFRQFQVLATA